VEEDYVTCHIRQATSAVGDDTSGRTGEGGGGSDEADSQLLFSFTTSYGDTTNILGQKLTKFAFRKIKMESKKLRCQAEGKENQHRYNINENAIWLMWNLALS
jgi:hypothetical protein